MKIIDSLRFHIIRLLSLRKLKGNKQFDNNAIYLTFDDGPEPGITEFVLDELNKYNAKAIFFCKGENCTKYPELYNKIVEQGHIVANHTYSHINGWETNDVEYINDVEKCEQMVKTHLFRPPWGKLTFKQYKQLSKEYRIVLWDNVSGDTKLDDFDFEKQMQSLKANTAKGKIILFHFCNRHEKETKALLPAYLQFLREMNITTSVL